MNGLPIGPEYVPVLVPVLGALALPWLGRLAAPASLAFAVLTLLATLALPFATSSGGPLRPDALAMVLAPVIGLVGMVAAWDVNVIPVGRLGPGLFQLVLAATLAAVLAANPFASWGALAVVLLAAGTLLDDARLLLPGAAALLLALFGSLLLLGGAPLGVALALLLAGYGAIMLLALLRPVGGREAALVAGALPVAALGTLLRLRGVAAYAASGASSPGLPPVLPAPGLPLMLLGLLMLLVAGGVLLRRREADFLVWSGIAQAGIVLAGFGIGGQAATAMALLHLAIATLARLAVSAARDSRLLVISAILALGLLPPFGLFITALRLLGLALDAAPWFAVPFAAGLLALVWSALQLLPLPRSGPAKASFVALLPGWLCLALAMLLGLALPEPARQLLWQAASLP